jgi:hypothetical protein
MTFFMAFMDRSSMIDHGQTTRTVRTTLRIKDLEKAI